MNRAQRRKMSKNLGIMQFQRKLPQNKKFELMQENIMAGQKKEKEFKEEVQRQLAEQDEEKASSVISSIAEAIAKRKQIPMIDALQEANIEYKKSHK